MSKALSASLGVPSSPGTYSAALEGLTGVNEVLMRRDPSIPPLYSTGAVWEIRPGDPSETQWRYAPDVVTQGWGDCQDLSAYRAAELRVSGEDPGAAVRVYPTGPNRYHAVVARGNGAVEDPSVILGMNPVPEAPMSTNQLPAVAGNSVVPVLGSMRQHLLALHPNVRGFLGPECGRDSKFARIRDVAPEVTGPTFHVTPHRSGTVQGFKGVHRVPLKDGTAIVGMTRTYSNPTDCIGDGPGIMTRIGQAILNHPVISALVSPEAYVATRALMDPGTQYALNTTAQAAKSSAGNSSDGWPAVWGATSSRNLRAATPGSPLTAKGAASAASYHTGQPANIFQGTVAQAKAAAGQSTTQIPAGTINPATGLPFPAGTTINPTTGQPTYPPGAINPQTGMPYAATAYPGYPPQYPGMPPGYNPMTGQYAPGYYPPPSSQSYGAAYNAPTSADFGLSATPDFGPSGSGGGGNGGGFGGFSDSDYNAYETYADPTSQIGYWNT
jgi:hypothetical protein